MTAHQKKAMKETVAIIGAGPAGSVCARELANAGGHVLLFDCKAPWDKPCGGMINPYDFKDLTLFDHYNGSIAYHDAIHFRFPRNLHYTLAFENPLPVLMRHELNGYVLDRAVDSGALFKRERVTGISFQFDEWEIITDSGRYSAGFIIGADGVTSIVRNTMVGRIPRSNISVMYGYDIQKCEDHQCTITYDALLGFIWEFPNTAYTNIGIGAIDGSIRINEMAAMLELYLQKYHPHEHRIRKWSSLVPTIVDTEHYDIPLQGEHWLIMGDAAGFVNPLMGEGIVYAIKSGIHAARAILSRDVSQYTALCNDDFLPVLKKKTEILDFMIKMADTPDKETFGALMYSYFNNK
jgi:flavin-dependent dehydrogenase